MAVNSTYINTDAHDSKFTEDLSCSALHTWVNKLKTVSAHNLLDYTLLPQTKEHLMLTLSYQRFLPSPDLMSAILGAVLNPRASTDLLTEPQHKDLGTSFRCRHHFYQFLFLQVLTIHHVMLKGLKLSITNDIFYLYTVALMVGESIQGNIVEENIMRVLEIGVAVMYIQLVGLRTYCPHDGPIHKKSICSHRTVPPRLQMLGSHAQASQPSDQKDGLQSP
jgi:hypothetical protein